MLMNSGTIHPEMIKIIHTGVSIMSLTQLEMDGIQVTSIRVS